MLSYAIWLLFLGNYLILFLAVNLNFYFENIVFFIYSLTLLLIGLIIIRKIKFVKINSYVLLIAIFIIFIVTSISLTFNPNYQNELPKLLYIVLCLVASIEAYILGINVELFQINFRIIKILSVLSLSFMLSVMLYDIAVLKVFRFASNSNAIGTSRAIATGFLFIFSIYFFQKRYFLSFFVYLVGLVIAFISGTRQVFISYLILIAFFSLVPYFKGVSLLSVKNMGRVFIFVFLIGFISFTIYNTKIKGGEIKSEKFSYIEVVFQRYHGGYHNKFTAISEREKLLFESIESIYSNPIWGDFQYNQKLGNFAHLMLIDFYATFGIFPLIIFIFINIIVLFKLNLKLLKVNNIYFFFIIIYIFLSIPSLIVTTFLIHPFYYFTLFYLYGFKPIIPDYNDISTASGNKQMKLKPTCSA